MDEVTKVETITAGFYVYVEQPLHTDGDTK